MNDTHVFTRPLQFTIRVYGILINQHNELLVSDEYIRGNYFTKLPGGGLEFGEGTRDCLQREFMEETGLHVTIGDHIYTTDFFQVSAFNERHQMMAIYYYVTAANTDHLHTKTTKFDFTPEQIADPQGQSEVLRWVPWEEVNEQTMDLPIDKIVIAQLKQQKKQG